LKRESSK